VRLEGLNLQKETWGYTVRGHKNEKQKTHKQTKKQITCINILKYKAALIKIDNYKVSYYLKGNPISTVQNLE
jgi:hypothetical protein